MSNGSPLHTQTMDVHTSDIDNASKSTEIEETSLKYNLDDCTRSLFVQHTCLRWTLLTGQPGH